MKIDLLRSKPILDRTAEATGFEHSSPYRGGVANDGNLIHAHVEFKDYAGDPPHVRVSIQWADVEAMINAFADNEHPEAVKLKTAVDLASAVAQVAGTRKR